MALNNFKLLHGTGNPNAKVLFLRDSPSFEDIRAQEHLTDSAGKEFRKMVAEAGMLFSETFTTSVSPSILQGKLEMHFTDKKSKALGKPLVNGMFVSKEILDHLPLLEAEIARLSPNIIVPLGPIALWLCTGETSIKTWRGSLNWSERFNTKIIATHDPSMILKVWNWRYASVRDLQRVQVQSFTKEVKMPDYKFTIRPSYVQTMVFLQGLINKAEELKS